MPSERTPWRGMWVERKLAETQSGAEFIFRLEHPSAVKPAPAPKPEALPRLIEELDDDAIAESEARLPPPSPPSPLPDPKLGAASLASLASSDKFATARAPTKGGAIQIGPGQ